MDQVTTATSNVIVPEVNPLDVKAAPKQEETTLLKNIVSTQTAKAQKPILGAAPELDTSLLQGMLPPKSLLLVVLKLLFGFMLVGSMFAILFFTSQLTDRLDFVAPKLGISNTSQELAATNSEIIKLQTNLNLFRYLQIKSDLDRFSFDGDSYLQYYEIAQSQTATNGDKDDARASMITVRSKLRESFKAAGEKFSKTFAAPLIDTEYQDGSKLDELFAQKLQEELNEKAALLANSDNEEARRDYKNYSQAVKLVGNGKLKNLILGSDFDALSDEELYNLVKEVNSLIVNDLSIIQDVKDKRIKWSDIINEIDLRTIAVDSYYNEDLYEDVGGIRYNSYDFDTDARTITIVGETKSFDITNFTLIANLIDELNNSELFEHGEMRSFSKTGSLDEGYTATLKLSLDLEGDTEIVEEDLSALSEEEQLRLMFEGMPAELRPPEFQ